MRQPGGCTMAFGVLDAVFVSGGRRIVTVGTDGTQLWNARDGRLVDTWAKGKREVTPARTSPAIAWR